MEIFFFSFKVSTNQWMIDWIIVFGASQNHHLYELTVITLAFILYIETHVNDYKILPLRIFVLGLKIVFFFFQQEISKRTIWMDIDYQWKHAQLPRKWSLLVFFLCKSSADRDQFILWHIFISTCFIH